MQIGRPRHLGGDDRSDLTGIDKAPVSRIMVGSDGVKGDAVVSRDHHGGPDQAVYVYTRSDYRAFESALAVSLAGGTFGENVTVERLPDEVRIGDRLHAGEVTLEITAPRIPCATFAARMREVLPDGAARGWVKRFVAARRPGWYCRVLAEGELLPGLRVDVERMPEGSLTGLELFDIVYSGGREHVAADVLARALAAPIAVRSRAWLQADGD